MAGMSHCVTHARHSCDAERDMSGQTGNFISRMATGIFHWCPPGCAHASGLLLAPPRAMHLRACSVLQYGGSSPGLAGALGCSGRGALQNFGGAEIETATL